MNQGFPMAKSKSRSPIQLKSCGGKKRERESGERVNAPKTSINCSDDVRMAPNSSSSISETDFRKLFHAGNEYKCTCIVHAHTFIIHFLFGSIFLRNNNNCCVMLVI